MRTIAIYFFIPLIICIFLVDPNPNNPNAMVADRVVDYHLNWDLISPTDSILDAIVGQPLKKFNQEKLLLILGNSIANGSGSLQKNNLSLALAKDREVFNAALDGAPLEATVALALWGLDTRMSSVNALKNVDIVLLYPLSRLYYQPGAGSGLDFLRTLCESKIHDLSPDLCLAAPKAQEWYDSLADSMSNFIQIHLRCMITPTLVFEWISNGEISCTKAFDLRTSRVTPLKSYKNSNLPWTAVDIKKAQFYLEQNLFWLFSPKEKGEQLSHQLKSDLDPLIVYLRSHNINYKIHFLVTQESPKALALLSDQEVQQISLGRTALLRMFREQVPELRTTVLPPFLADDYFDYSHFKESGQKKVAEAILKLIRSSKNVLNN